MSNENTKEKNNKEIFPAEQNDLIRTHDFESPEVLYDRLITNVKAYHPSDDISMIKKD